MPTIEKQRALSLLQGQLDRLPALRDLSVNDADFKAWQNTTSTTLAQLFGNESEHYKKFEAIPYWVRIAFSQRESVAERQARIHDVFVRGLGSAQARIEAAKHEIINFWPDKLNGEQKRVGGS